MGGETETASTKVFYLSFFLVMEPKDKFHTGLLWNRNQYSGDMCQNVPNSNNHRNTINQTS